MRARRVLGPLLLLFLLLPGGIAHAQQQAPVRITVRPLFQGFGVGGQATMLRVTLENDGPDLDGEVQAVLDMPDLRASYSLPLALPRHSRKEVSLLVGPLPYQAVYGTTYQIPVRFVAGGKARTETLVSLTIVAESDFFIGLLTDDPAPFSFLATVKSPAILMPLLAEDLPGQVWPLRSADLLVLAGADTAGLSQAQQQALAQWVGAGGHLVVAGGPQANLTVAGLPDGLLPVSLEGETTLDRLPSLEVFAGEEIPPAGPYVVSQATVRSGTVLLTESHLPLIVSQPYGLGEVTFLALDPTLAPLRSWAGNEALWRQLLRADPRPASSGQLGSPDPQHLTNMVGHLAGVRLPSMWGIAGLLLLYIFLVGPVTYLVLRWRRRLDWAWATIPALTVLFAVGVYGLGLATRGGNRSLASISIVRMASGGPAALADHYAGLLSPRRENYTISAGPHALFGPVPGYPGYGPYPRSPSSGSPIFSIVPGDTPILDNFRVEQWSMRTFRAQTVLDPAPAIQAQMRRQGNQASLALSNGTGAPLRDCMLLGQGQFAAVGDVSGASRSSNVTLGTSVDAFQAYFYALDPTFTEVINSVFNWDPFSNGPPDLSLVCWAEGSPASFDLHGKPARQEGRTIYLIAPGPGGTP